MSSSEGYQRRLAERVRMNHAILKNKYWYLPVDDKGHENYMPVGRGVPSSPDCARWASFSVCKNVEGHDGVVLGGSDCTGKVVVRHNHLWCKKPSCPICFIRGWSPRVARSIAGRLVEGEKRGFGKVEHIVSSCCVADRDLPEHVLRARCRKALVDRGVSGSVMIFHAYREDRERHVLVWSPHYHIMGFLKGGYRCRDCRQQFCSKCDGFEGLTRRLNASDGFIVRVLGKRQTVVGTAFYQANHASLRLGVRRFHCFTWWGNCSCSKFKAEKLKAEILCPVCHNEMSRCAYVGKRRVVKDVGSADYVRVFGDDEFDASGAPNYVELGGGGGRFE